MADFSKDENGKQPVPNYEKDEYHRSSGGDGADLALRKTGRITLSKDFVAKHGITRGMGAEIYWAGDNGSLALVFTSNKGRGSYPLVFVPRQEAAYIVAGQSFAKHGIKTKEYLPEDLVGPREFDVMPAGRLGIDHEGDAFVIEFEQAKD